MQQLSALDLQSDAAAKDSDWKAPAIFATLTLAIFGATLVRTKVLVAQPGDDATAHVLWWRSFGFSALAHAHFPFWNPHLAAGVPYFAAFQSALLYPPNWIFLVLPTALAINWSFAIHTFASGWFMQMWAGSKGMSWLASMLAGLMYMFGGMTWLRIEVGHHMAVCSLPWIPIILWAIDGLLRDGQYRWCLLGGGAVALQIFAGFPQFIYYTGLMAGLYLLCGLSRLSHNRRAIAGLVAIYVIGSGIAAVQLLAAVQVNGEGPRSSGLDYKSASAGALVPADLLTLACPLAFGDGSRLRNYAPGGIGESSLFIGGAGAVLALAGALAGRTKLRRTSLIMVGLTFVLALGHYTPFYWPLYKWLPIYGTLRDVGRFNLFVGLFMILLAAEGFDRLRDGTLRCRRWWSVGPLMVAMVLLAAGATVYASSNSRMGGVWDEWIQQLDPSGSMQRHVISRTASSTPQQTAKWAAGSLAIGGIVLAAAAALWWLAAVSGKRQTNRWAAAGIAGLLVIELLAFAGMTRPTVDLPLPYPAKWKRLAVSAGTSRITHCTGSSEFIDRAMVDGTYEANIYDQTQLTRYKMLFDFASGFGSTSGKDAGGIAGDVFPPPSLSICRAAFTRYPAIWQMLRLKYVFVGDHAHSVIELPDPLPQVQLVRHVKVVESGVKTALAALADPSFNPRETAILDAAPEIVPSDAEGPVGSVRIVRQTIDSIELRADLPAAAMVIITDSYSPGWTAKALPRSCQKNYKVVPADLALRGIALSAGRHHLLLSYRPPPLRAGIAITSLTLMAYGALVIAGWCRGFR
jgi:hypothetical protein